MWPPVGTPVKGIPSQSHTLVDESEVRGSPSCTCVSLADMLTRLQGGVLTGLTFPLSVVEGSLAIFLGFTASLLSLWPQCSLSPSLPPAMPYPSHLPLFP